MNSTILEEFIACFPNFELNDGLLKHKIDNTSFPYYFNDTIGAYQVINTDTTDQDLFEFILEKETYVKITKEKETETETETKNVNAKVNQKRKRNDAKKSKLKEKEEYEEEINTCSYCDAILDVYHSIHTTVTCGKPICLAKMNDRISNDTIISNVVSNFIRSEPDIWNMLLETCKAAATSTRHRALLDPFPIMYYTEKTEELQKNRGTVIALDATINELLIPDDIYNSIAGACSEIKKQTLIKKTFTSAEIQISSGKRNLQQNNKDIVYKFIAKDSLTDYDLLQVLGETKYNLAHFLVTSVSEMHMNLEERIINDKRILIVPIRHSLDKESNLNDENGRKLETMHLFHGSSIDCWYSIMRNGIKICSQTKLQTTGTAHGNGVYVSNNAMTSLGYCRGGNILGIYEVSKKHLKYGGKQIDVCLDDSKLLLRYLILNAHNSSMHLNVFLKELNERQSVSPPQHPRKTDLVPNAAYSTTIPVVATSSRRGMKRLVVEYRKSLKTDQFTVDLPDPDDLYVWNVYIRDFGDSNLEISKQMKEYGIEYIHIEIRFPDSYPINPPFIRIVSPVFMRFSGHITSKGAICMQLLTPGNWMATYCVEAIIVQIKQQIIDGSGLIDRSQIGIKYDLNEALSSFRVVAKGHGWM